VSPQRSLAPTVPALVFLTWSVAVTLAFGNRLLNADGDTARHIRHGEWILQHGLIRADPFSFSRAGEPFVGFEYGSQVVFGLVHRLAGLPGIVVLSALLIAATWALVARFLLRRGVEPAFAYCVTMASSILGAMHWAARPHLFTQLFVVTLLGWLDRPRAARPRWWAFGGLFLLWANLHGGWLYGLILIGLFALPDLFGWLARRDDSERRRAAASWVAVGATAAAVTVLNPYGVELPLHVLGFFRSGLIQSQTSEFMPPGFRDLGTRLFLLGIVVAVAALARSRRPLPVGHLLVVSANLAFALMARRNIALFVLTALPLLALHFDSSARRLPEPPNFRASFAEAQRRGRFWLWAAPVALLVSLLAAAGGRVGGARIVADGFDPGIFPTQAVAQARQAGVQGRIFSEFLWGGYMLYAWPEQKVFIDGGTDHYGDEILREYLEIWTLRPGWRARFRHWEFQHALVPTKSALAAELVAEPGWGVWWCDPRAVLLSRDALPEGPAQPNTPECEALTRGR